jgi:hypothetical protein
LETRGVLVANFDNRSMMMIARGKIIIFGIISSSLGKDHHRWD